MLLKHIAGIFALPVTVIIIIPALIVCLFPFVIACEVQYITAISLLIAGTFLISLGFILLYSTIKLFIKEGDGIIAPWNPTEKLIITGFYSHVRNPMHIGVFLILTGESLIIGSLALILWALLFIVGNLIYIPAIEEQKLEERFEEEYLIYKRNVPRWIPRLSSWKPDT
jgi:protein-S-isoprenylcysteine O-methyltransferase Ste14